jgi:hypothetical protein
VARNQLLRIRPRYLRGVAVDAAFGWYSSMNIHRRKRSRARAVDSASLFSRKILVRNQTEILNDNGT